MDGSSVVSGETTYGNRITISGESTEGTHNYVLSVTNSQSSEATQCPFNVEYDDDAGIAMTNGDMNIAVPCNKSIEAMNTNTSGCNAVLSCSGSFTKKVGNVTADQYNSANYTVGKVSTATVTTECSAGNTMSCTWNCW
jgi:hypothetical protein